MPHERSGMEIKPCEIRNSDDYNCLKCQHFNLCQMTNIDELKNQLDDDY